MIVDPRRLRLEHEAALVPRMADLSGAKRERSRHAVAAIIESSAKFARLVGLRDCLSIDSAGGPTFSHSKSAPP
jgi:hypothetical protein